MHKIVATVALVLLANTAQSAETSMRPGLWEIATTSDLLLLVPHIPADQMQGIKDLASEYGLEIPPIENGAAISQACMTPEMAKQKSPPIFAENALGCVSKNATRIGDTYKMDFVCDSAELKGNGSAEGTIINAESFTGKTKFSGTAQGNAVNEQADISGKWIGAICGQIKPL